MWKMVPDIAKAMGMTINLNIICRYLNKNIFYIICYNIKIFEMLERQIILKVLGASKQRA
jgi:hypothetical protein